MKKTVKEWYAPNQNYKNPLISPAFAEYHKFPKTLGPGVELYSENNESYNLGSPVNTIYWESQGVFSPDGEYLYFVSNNPGGYGGKDIWRSKKCTCTNIRD